MNHKLESRLLGEISTTSEMQMITTLMINACNAGDLGLIPGLGRSPAEGNGKPLQYSCMENPMDRGAWRATVHGVTRVGGDLAIKPAYREWFQSLFRLRYCS